MGGKCFSVTHVQPQRNMLPIEETNGTTGDHSKKPTSEITQQHKLHIDDKNDSPPQPENHKVNNEVKSTEKNNARSNHKTKDTQNRLSNLTRYDGM